MLKDHQIHAAACDRHAGLAEFGALTLTFPTDFSSLNRTDASEGFLPARIGVETNFDTTSDLRFPTLVTPEGDVLIDAGKPDLVPDETDAATPPASTSPPAAASTRHGAAGVPARLFDRQPGHHPDRRDLRRRRLRSRKARGRGRRRRRTVGYRTRADRPSRDRPPAIPTRTTPQMRHRTCACATRFRPARPIGTRRNASADCRARTRS